jgi:hypothetical protein
MSSARIKNNASTLQPRSAFAHANTTRLKPTGLLLLSHCDRSFYCYLILNNSGAFG